MFPIDLSSVSIMRRSGAFMSPTGTCSRTNVDVNVLSDPEVISTTSDDGAHNTSCGRNPTDEPGPD